MLDLIDCSGSSSETYALFDFPSQSFRYCEL